MEEQFQWNTDWTRSIGYHMTPQSRLRQIAAMVNDLPMDEVLSTYGVHFARRSGRRLLSLCPMHPDTSLGSFSVDLGKNTCWCYACCQGGSNIRTYSTMFDVEDKEAILQIACDFDIIDQKEYEELMECEYERVTRTVSKAILFKKPVVSKEALEARTCFYEFMRDFWGLSAEHEAHLRNVRKLSDDRIKKDYFSIYTKSVMGADVELIKAFKAAHPEYADQVLTFPGVYEHKLRNMDIWVPRMLMFDGIGILIRDAEGYIPGVQIRMDEKDINGMRYKFMSYAFGDNDSNSRGGTTCGTPIDVLYPETITAQTSFCIAEGRFKTEILKQQGCIAASVQGVNNFYGIEETIKEVSAHIGRTIQEVFVFYDADFIRNVQVFKALLSLYEYLKEELPDIKIYVMVWGEQYGKGIDDCIIAGNRNRVKSVSMDLLAPLYEKAVYEASILANVEGLKPANMTKEDRERYNTEFGSIVYNELFL